MDSLPVLLAGPDWQTILDSGTRTILERQALQSFLLRQRWFGSRTRTIRRATLSDWTRIKDGAEPAFLSIGSVEYTDGWKESYVVPLALLSGVSAERAVEQSPGIVLARITGARRGAIIDGMYDAGTCERLHQIATDTREVVTAAGSVRGRPRPPLSDEASATPSVAARSWTNPTGDQSNSVVVSDDERVLKLFRRTEPGPNPEYEISCVLADQRFARTPPLLGALEYNRRGLEPGSLAIVQKHITHQGTGWQYTIDELRRYYERVSARTSAGPAASNQSAPSEASALASGGDGHVDPSPFFRATQGWYLRGAALLGKRTAELHLALAASTDPAFVPVPLEVDALGELANVMDTRATTTLEILKTQIETLPEALRPQAQSVLANQERLVAHFGELRRLNAAGMLIRIHGDYHLGQVLRTEEDFYIIDFEGEPARTLAERRARQSPLKDVAGMLRSYSYAAYAALFAFALHAPEDFDTLVPWAHAWQRWVADAFVREYRGVLGESAIVPSTDDEAFDVVLRALTVDKALYELAYELNNRPEWARIPLMGLLTLAQ